MNPPDQPACSCWATADKGKSMVLKVAPSASLSVLVAFFPKCPMCWAAYSSWLGLAGIFQIPYMGFLFPVLVVLLAVHLLLLGKHVAQVGWGPLLTCVAGAITLLLVRQLAPDLRWALNIGILLMLAGSLWNTHAVKRGQSQSF